MAADAAFVEEQIRAFPAQRAHYEQLLDLFQKKLWFQISGKLLEVTREPFFRSGTHLLDLHRHFVKRFDSRLKPLDLVRFSAAAATQCADPGAAEQFLDEVAKVVAGIQGEDTALAAVYLRLEVIFYHLRRAASTADRVALEQQCKQALDECREQLRHYAHAIDPVVHSQLYRAALEFHRVFGSANEFFHNAILFLSYTPLEQLSHDEQARLAAEVVEAALVGDRVYNFGELLQHPILEVLRGSPLRWLADLLTAFNTGDMKAYMAITAQMPPSPQRDLMVRHAGFLNQKIRVMALMEAVFNRIDLDRTLTFAEISSICEVPLNEVERLLLKAFALKVVRGSVDEVEKRVRISWVQPRVLSREQVAQLGARVSGWAKKVHDTAHLMQTQFQ